MIGCQSHRWPVGVISSLTRSTLTNQEGPIFFLKKNRQDLIGAKHTPGCVFLFFLQEKTLTQCMLGRDGRNAKAFALRCDPAKITRCWQRVQVYCYRSFLSFPVSFAAVVVLLHAKLVLLFLPAVVSGHFGCVRLLVGERFCVSRCRCVCVCGLQTQKLGSRLFPWCFSCLF